MATILFHDCRLIDGIVPESREGFDVLIEGERIKEVADRPIKATGAQRIALGGRTLMPGLIDAHVHVTAVTEDYGRLGKMAPSFVTAGAVHILKGMLDRGFTTVRDAGGADLGLKEALDQGLIEGPRLFVSGKILTQTGGNVDFRERGEPPPTACCCPGPGIGRLVDGVTDVRRAARDELRKGADQIKINASGGVAGPSGGLKSVMFSRQELGAIVEEAAAWRTYAMAHAYSAPAVRQAVECGVRSIEHGNLIDAGVAALMAARGAFLVPTLSVYRAAYEQGEALGLAPYMMDKLKQVLDGGLNSLEVCRNAGVKLGHGSDLLGALHHYQSLEFSLKGEVLSPAEVIAAAKAANAEIINMSGELGVIAPGALAELLVVEGDPLADLGLLQDQGKHLAAIIKGGEFHKNRII